MSLPWSVSDVTCHMPPSSAPQMMSTGHLWVCLQVSQMLHATCHLPLHRRWWARATTGPPSGRPHKQVGEGWLPCSSLWLEAESLRAPILLNNMPLVSRAFLPSGSTASLLPASQGSQDRRGEGFLILHSWQGQGDSHEIQADKQAFPPPVAEN